MTRPTKEILHVPCIYLINTMLKPTLTKRPKYQEANRIPIKDLANKLTVIKEPPRSLPPRQGKPLVYYKMQGNSPTC